ncbi:1,2-phenylacetyl-CoA epoxidase subunit PaaD [Curvivirga aplysinae]|uniref:1,2-phenylacetyl-CoA epoxidase subunit PaaD n=1 Tax=Curvivirga aplysinae TaxID=2529852 RepID=UPI0012BCF928|nr:1,2-phenylacetyl-CoA epoxidase subunit PaaD [Curvivirga aplysinae]MTI09869.1 phenylacetate-CoA oxygenase subunit PaaJ [Curvivirga aplysinae]
MSVEISHNHNLPEEALIWDWLNKVPDPEVPVVSVVDLGIVRDVVWQDDELKVVVTPTYSGCPATRVISMDIETALRDKGIEKVSIETRLSPAWTTDWLSDAGRDKLREYGIAPPSGETTCGITGKDNTGQPETMACPKCNSTNTKCVSWFGSTPCKASYQCNDCLEPFDYFKCI